MTKTKEKFFNRFNESMNIDALYNILSIFFSKFYAQFPSASYSYNINHCNVDLKF
jgi:hypothetical protein